MTREQVDAVLKENEGGSMDPKSAGKFVLVTLCTWFLAGIGLTFGYHVATWILGAVHLL